MMYVSCGEPLFSEAMRVWYCAVLLSESMRVRCDQCARGHRGSGYGRDGSCEGRRPGMHVRWGEVVRAICDPQDVAMPVQLEHVSGGSREAAQVFHALDRELEHDAAPKLVALVLRLDLELDFFLN